MKKLFQLLLLFVLLGCNSGPKQKEKLVNGQDQLIGFYEFRAGQGGKNQYIQIDTLHNKLYGIYYRMEPKRTKGLWYYAHSLQDLDLTDGRLSFSLGEQKLFTIDKVPPSINTDKLMGSPKTASGGSISFLGTVKEDKILLECTATSGNCEEGIMTFRRILLQ